MAKNGVYGLESFSFADCVEMVATQPHGATKLRLSFLVV